MPGRMYEVVVVDDCCYVRKYSPLKRIRSWRGSRRIGYPSPPVADPMTRLMHLVARTNCLIFYYVDTYNSASGRNMLGDLTRLEIEVMQSKELNRISPYSRSKVLWTTHNWHTRRLGTSIPSIPSIADYASNIGFVVGTPVNWHDWRHKYLFANSTLHYFHLLHQESLQCCHPRLLLRSVFFTAIHS